MSEAAEILVAARQAGLRVWRVGDQLAIAPARLCPPALLEAIRQNKPALLEALENACCKLPPDCLPWIQVAKQVLAGEFDAGTRSELDSILFGVRGAPHPKCRAAQARLEMLLGRKPHVTQDKHERRSAR